MLYYIDIIIYDVYGKCRYYYVDGKSITNEEICVSRKYFYVR